MPLGREACEALRRYLASGRPYLDRCHRPELFLNAKGGPLTRSGVFLILRKLAGKPLACWCRHDGSLQHAGNTCHGDLLVHWLNTYTDDELRELNRLCTKLRLGPPKATPASPASVS